MAGAAVALQNVHQLETVQPGHHDIAEDQIRLLDLRLMQTFLSIPCFQQLVRRGQLMAQQHAHVRIIFDDQNPPATVIFLSVSFFLCRGRERIDSGGFRLPRHPIVVAEHALPGDLLRLQVIPPHGKKDRKSAALSRRAADGHLSMVRLHQLAPNRQTEARTRNRNAVLIPVAVEIVEEVRQDFRRNPRSVISDRNLRAFPLGGHDRRLQRHPGPPSARSVFQGIVDQIAEDLLDFVRIQPDHQGRLPR